MCVKRRSQLIFESPLIWPHSKSAQTENRQFHFMVKFTMPRCKQYVPDCHQSALSVVTCDVIAGIIKFSHQKKIHVTCAKLIASRKKKSILPFVKRSVVRYDSHAMLLPMHLGRRYENHKYFMASPHQIVSRCLNKSVEFFITQFRISCCAMFAQWNSRCISCRCYGRICDIYYRINLHVHTISSFTATATARAATNLRPPHIFSRKIERIFFSHSRLAAHIQTEECKMTISLPTKWMPERRWVAESHDIIPSPSLSSSLFQSIRLSSIVPRAYCISGKYIYFSLDPSNSFYLPQIVRIFFDEP